MEEANIKLLCEIYHFKKSVEMALSQITDPTQKKKLKMACDRIGRNIDKYCDGENIPIQDLTGLDFYIGLPVNAMNLDEFDENDKLFIEAMLEPVIKEKNSPDILHEGKVFLAKK